MKFRLSNIQYDFYVPDKFKDKKLRKSAVRDMEYMEKLKKYGFKFKKQRSESGMTFYQCKTQDNLTIEINTLEDLINFMNDIGSCIILTTEEIKVYDGYVE